MLTLGELCELVAGRVPLVVELKSQFDGDLRLTQRAAGAAPYNGPVGGDVVRPGNRRAASQASRRRSRAASSRSGTTRTPNGPELSAASKRGAGLSCCTRLRTRPHFVAYSVEGPALAGRRSLRARLRPAVLTWTVRSRRTGDAPRATPTR